MLNERQLEKLGINNQELGMNAKQEKYCLEYLKDFNATEAAERAGYSKKTAYSIGGRLLKNVEIKKRIDELKMKQVKKSELKIEAIIKELMKIGFAKVDGDKIKTSDKLKALEMLGKYLGMFNKEKINYYKEFKKLIKELNKELIKQKNLKLKIYI